MRATRIRVSTTLHESETPFVEDVEEAAELRMQTERLSGRIGAHLQHLPCGHGNAGPAAVVSRVAIRDQRVQRIVATAQIDDDEVPRPEALCLGDRTQEGGRGEPECDSRYAVADEESSR